MINKENFTANFQYYSNDVVIQIIDMFIEDHAEDMRMIEQSIINKDFAGIKFHSHHLKGSIANFMDPEATELARQLEAKGETQDDEGLVRTFAELQVAVKLLIQEIQAYRKSISFRDSRIAV
jgi:HPt (histidine-containing phosphotransfer) domain-containing protein